MIHSTRQHLRNTRRTSDYLDIFDHTSLLSVSPDDRQGTTRDEVSGRCYQSLRFPKTLVIGYYDKGNLGDEAYKASFAKIGPVTHVSSDKITHIPDDIEVVICGGGDIINTYFFEHIQPL